MGETTPSPEERISDPWWKDVIIYAVDVERFCDSDGDGQGDFKGLTSSWSRFEPRMLVPVIVDLVAPADHNPLLFLHNLKDKPVTVDVELAPGMEALKPFFGGESGSVEDGRLRLKLDAYGFRWLGRGRSRE